jgi:coiled-coil domain-containing protein 61
MSANIEYTYNFKGVDYLIYLSANENTLRIDLENQNECQYWRTECDAKKLEEISVKLKSYKPYHVILKMITSALGKETDAVIVELLSYQDLEALKMKRSNNSMNDSTYSEQGREKKMNQKYLIITYMNEFEKLNIPLTMEYLRDPDKDCFSRTIERLRKNKSNVMGGNSFINFKEIEEVKLENVNLKNKIKLLESQRKYGAVDNDESLRNYTNLKDEYETYKTQTESKLKLLTKTIEDFKANFSNSDHSQAENNEKYIKIITELENKLKKAEEILVKERREGQQYIDEKNKDIERVMKENNHFKENEKKLNVKIKQLEKELDFQMKRSVYNTNMSRTKNSFKSNMSYNSSVRSETSNNSKSSLKKDLLANPYNKFKGLNNKGYSPFKSTKSVGSNKSATKSIYSKNSYTSNYSKPKSSYSGSSSKVSKTYGTTFIPKKSNNQVKSTISKYTVPSKTTTVKREPKQTTKPPTKIATTNDDINARLSRIQHLLNTAKS